MHPIKEKTEALASAPVFDCAAAYSQPKHSAAQSSAVSSCSRVHDAQPTRNASSVIRQRYLPRYSGASLTRSRLDISTGRAVIYFTNAICIVSRRALSSPVWLSRLRGGDPVLVEDGDMLILTETMAGNVIQLIETWQDVPYPLPAGTKGRLKTRRPGEQVTAFLVHQTAVRGGFGVTSSQIAATPDHLPEAERRQIARQARYRKTPYHGIYDPQSRVSIVQWPIWAYMWHGNGGNAASFGWAIDGLWDRSHADDLDVDASREAMRHALDCGFRQGAEFECVESHAQHSAGRQLDPGAEIWRGVVLPVAAEFGLGVSMRTTGTGKIPTWQRQPPQ